MEPSAINTFDSYLTHTAQQWFPLEKKLVSAARGIVHDSLILTAALMLGIGVTWVVWG